MINILFINICIIVTFIYFSGLLSKRYAIEISSLSLPVQIFSGILFGIYGIILMNYTIPVGSNTYADLRHLFIIVIGTYLGVVPAIISSIIIGIGRMALYGFTTSGIVACIGMIAIGIISAIISQQHRTRFYKINLMNIISMFVILILLVINIKDIPTVMSFYPLQLGIAIITGLFVYLITEHIYSTNALFINLEERATTDHLTQLNNLRQFESILKSEMTHSQDHRETLSLLAIDIDHFKKINDTYGHAAGDEVLKSIGKILVTYARSFDVVSRNGGEEFTVLLLDCPLPYALIIAERIRVGVENHSFILPNHTNVSITISIGVATYPDTVSEPIQQALVDMADKALYKAKETGRNKVCS
jgi:diguanylate cyclase